MVIFPNYAALSDNGSIMLEASYGLLCDALVESLGQVTVAAVVSPRDTPGAYREVSDEAVCFVTLAHRGAGLWGKLRMYVSAWPRVWQVVVESNFCYIFVPGHIGLIAAIVCLISGREFGIYLRGDWRANTPRPLWWIRYLILRRARFVLCTGDGLTQEVRRINPRSDTVVPMSELLTKRMRPVRLQTHNDELALLFVGALSRDKGIYDLLDAVVQLRESGMANITLNVVGDGVERDGVRSYIDQHRLTSAARLHGFVHATAKLASLYARSDVFCLPTYHEGFPRVLYEAMWFSMPIVVTPVGQIRSVIHDNKNGVFVRVGNPVEIAQTIRLLAGRPELRVELGRQARLSVESLMKSWQTASHGEQVVRWMLRTAVRSSGRSPLVRA